MKPRLLAPLVFLSSLLVSCATGEAEPGVARDNCLRRDCGAAVGGQEAAVEEDADAPDEGPSPADAAVDSSTPDTGAPKDTAPADTFTPPVDTGACKPPSGVACSTLPQCGCSDGNNCDVTGVDGRTSCVPAGTKGKNQKCDALGQCAVGLSCVFDVCLPFCSTTSDCAGVGSPTCRNVQYVDATTKVTKDVPGFKVCMQQCDPVNPSKVCGASTNCVFTSSTQTTCAAAATSTTAGTCASDPFTCAPGYVCVGTGDCRRWCRIGFAGDCPTGKTCGKLTSAPTSGGIEYGVCAY
jgi:hypothetical protein